MHWKATFAGLLAMLLIGVGCAASACEVSCAREFSAGGCHLAGRTMRASAECNPERVAAASVKAGRLCAAMPCAQPAASVAARPAALEPGLSMAALGTGLLPSAWSRSPRGRKEVRGAAPVLLRRVLRV